LEIKAKKRFGQNFLKDEIVKQKIIKAIPNGDDRVIEIGAGLGDLTKPLLEFHKVVAYEIDLELCEYLKERFSKEIEEERFELICGDVLSYWQNGNLREERYKIVANLPYYVATNIVLKALQDRNCISITVMVQKEVGNKFLAKVGERNFSSLSVIAESISEVKEVVFVPPTAFEPEPKVDSLVIQFQKNSGDEVSKDFQKFLLYAFQQPRKTLFKNLSTTYSKEELRKIFEERKLNLSLRPHQVTTIDYHQIYKNLRLQIGRERDSSKKGETI
jgi:16S rRNA (adenine1518-N6/adenine1519-N6)-dimethyltransferase